MTDVAERKSTEPNPATKLAVDRTRLAYERTMLSWIRTAISLITFGFGIQQFFRVSRTGAPESRGFIGPHEFGLMMIIIGLLALLLVTLEQRAAINTLRMQYPVVEGYLGIPRSRANLLAALIAVLGMLALSSMIFQK